MSESTSNDDIDDSSAVSRNNADDVDSGAPVGAETTDGLAEDESSSVTAEQASSDNTPSSVGQAAQMPVDGCGSAEPVGESSLSQEAKPKNRGVRRLKNSNLDPEDESSPVTAEQASSDNPPSSAGQDAQMPVDGCGSSESVGESSLSQVSKPKSRGVRRLKSSALDVLSATSAGSGDLGMPFPMPRKVADVLTKVPALDRFRVTRSFTAKTSLSVGSQRKCKRTENTNYGSTKNDSKVPLSKHQLKKIGQQKHKSKYRRGVRFLKRALKIGKQEESEEDTVVSGSENEETDNGGTAEDSTLPTDHESTDNSQIPPEMTAKDGSQKASTTSSVTAAVKAGAEGKRAPTTDQSQNTKGCKTDAAQKSKKKKVPTATLR